MSDWNKVCKSDNTFFGEEHGNFEVGQVHWQGCI